MSFEDWQSTLEERFPSSTVGQPFDLAPAIYDAYSKGKIPAYKISMRSTKRTSRTYLGASMLGAECARRTWAGYRGMTSFPGRVLKLFATGDVIEARVQQELKAIGFELTGDQAAMSAMGGMVRGHTDGFVRLLGLVWVLLEIKSANRRRFKDLQKKIKDLRDAGECQGLAIREWDAKYWGQIQIYMAFFDVPACLYVVVCKDTDAVETLLCPRDEEAVQLALDNAKQILTALSSPPPRGFPRPQQPLCTRFCDHKEWCWHDEAPPRVCAMCVHWRHGGKCALGGDAEEVCDAFDQVEVEGSKISWMDM